MCVWPAASERLPGATSRSPCPPGPQGSWVSPTAQVSTLRPAMAGGARFPGVCGRPPGLGSPFTARPPPCSGPTPWGGGVGTHATHLSYQVPVFCVDQDHGSQPLEEGEGFVELRREKQAAG